MKTFEINAALEILQAMSVHGVITDIVESHDESLEEAMQDLEYLRDEINRVLTQLATIEPC